MAKHPLAVEERPRKRTVILQEYTAFPQGKFHMSARDAPSAQTQLASGCAPDFARQPHLAGLDATVLEAELKAQHRRPPRNPPDSFDCPPARPGQHRPSTVLRPPPTIPLGSLRLEQPKYRSTCSGAVDRERLHPVSLAHWRPALPCRDGPGTPRRE